MLHSFCEKNRRTTMTAAGCALVMVCLVAPSAGAAALRAAARPQRPVPSEKEERSDASRNGVPPGATGVDVDARGRALVDVRAEVTPALQKTIRSLGGVVISSSPEYHSIMARVPLLRLERLAGGSAVRFIEPVARATTNDAK